MIPGHRTDCTETPRSLDPYCLQARRTEPPAAGNSWWWSLICTPRSQSGTRGPYHNTHGQCFNNHFPRESGLAGCLLIINKGWWRELFYGQDANPLTTNTINALKAHHERDQL